MRHQQLLTRFPEEWEILWIEPLVKPTLFKWFKNPRAIFREHGNIRIVSVPFPPIFDQYEFFRKLNDLLALLLIKSYMRIFLIKNPVLLLYNPRFAFAIGKLDESLVCFDYVDDLAEFTGVPRWFERYLDLAIYKADLVFVVSQILFEKVAERKKERVFLLANGVDVDHFSKALKDIELPSVFRRMKRPVIGYIGVLEDWIDFPLLKSIAATYRDYSIVLIGPAHPRVLKDVEEFRSFTNVFYLGKVPYEMLPNYLRGIDLCIIPFKINRLTKAANPLKVYEFLASGKRVVSSAIPEIEKLDVVKIAHSTDEFISRISESLSEPVDSVRFLEIAGLNTWDQKAGDMLSLIKNGLRMKSPRHD